MSTTNGTVN